MAFDTLGVNDFSEEVFWSVTIFSLKIIIETKLRKTMYLKTFFFFIFDTGQRQCFDLCSSYQKGYTDQTSS